MIVTIVHFNRGTEVQRERRRICIRVAGFYFRDERTGENPQAGEAAERSGSPEGIRLRSEGHSSRLTVIPEL